MAGFRSGWAIQIGLPDDRCLLRSINRANSDSTPKIQENWSLPALVNTGEPMQQRKEEARCTKNRRKLLDSAAKQIGKAEISHRSPEIVGGCL
ncbi:hypothetical protein QM996_20825 (plasmid) [Sinorhizobium chiapasense]|uniref:hypothetical protein n=1 Tax=Sinorhizobium chiapasense TaxID=501572 RepID=UPI002FE1B4AA